VYIKHIAQEQLPHQLQRGNRSLLTLLSTFARFHDKPIQDTAANVGNELLRIYISPVKVKYHQSDDDQIDRKR